MTRSRSVIPTKLPHGGRRPGAGAPKGNVNALRHGLHSRRFYVGALMVGVVPELRLLFDALQRAPDRRNRQRQVETIMAAYQATLSDPELARSIKSLVVQRVRQALDQVQGEYAPPSEKEIQSNNQEAAFIPILDTLPPLDRLRLP